MQFIVDVLGSNCNDVSVGYRLDSVFRFRLGLEASNGNGAGASDLAVQMADQAVTVPMAHSFTESFNVSVAAALILNEARQQRILKLGSCGDLSPEEIQTLTAIMLLKHRGGNALSWHPHWRQHAHSTADAQQPLKAILQAV